jgi:hypothetical protein
MLVKRLEWGYEESSTLVKRGGDTTKCPSDFSDGYAFSKGHISDTVFYFGAGYLLY